MKQNNSSESNRFSASQEIPCILHTHKAEESSLWGILLPGLLDPEDEEL
jgi:hypothetical protein